MRTSTKKNKTYPHIWRSGPDPVRHKLRLECQRNRAQAKYRGQEWHISEEEFTELWLHEDRHLQRGRNPNDLCMTRKDKNKPWSVTNVEFMTRRQHLSELYTGKSRLKNERPIECKR